MNKSTPSQASTLDASIDCIKVISLDGRLKGMSPDGMCLMEIDDFAPLDGAQWSSLWPAAHRSTLDQAVAKAASGQVARFSAECPTAKGTPKHWDVMVSPIFNQSGELSSLLAVSRDVTLDVLVAGERALVARELSHRMANMFTIVDGMIGLSARAHPAAKDFAASLRKRISGLGRAVSYVYSRSGATGLGEVSGTVHGLLSELLAPYGNANGSSISIEGRDHEVTETAITPLALIFNELATNSLKHGALAQPDGRIKVSTSPAGEAYRILWKESGAVGVEEPRSGGFGTTLLDRTVQVQLGGSMARNWLADGLAVEMQIPTSRLL